MAGLTTTTAANSIREAYAPSFEKAVFRNDSFLGLFPPWEAPPGNGDTAYRWKLNSAGNSSVQVFSENQVQPVAGYQAIVNAALSWLYVRGMMSFTGHALDALGSNWINAEQEEGSLLVEDLVDLMTTSFMGSTYGLELALAPASAYAGITRNGAASYFESSTAGSVGTLAYADLVDIQEAVRDNDKGGLKTRQGMWVCPVNQETNIYGLAQTSKTVNVNTDGSFAPRIANQDVCGYPLVALPDFTNTVIALLDMRPGSFRKIQIRTFRVDDQGRSGDSKIFQVSWGGMFVVRQPRFHGTLTGVTA